ncbi:metallo-beta-lactamase family protein [Cnuella takakiae]|uniref:Metallo-beta-lactamase family protein n=1 Tax=Cnuella takakiae TaxID=1302690 RepID=A0A1M5A913_9BACT|nr:MBL fold metallo-hydrolase [Cnuella takakiae]OLY94754.1 MBL fold metallo-hydrolase [Cnuella takakiae]SHF26768.1 metallo-beta-lactamase family protein [Cnuella takakiae]
MKLAFHGAAQTVTGSKHLLTLENGKKILLDCGMFQGMGKQTDDLNERFGFRPDTIDCVILSHAHIDHTGLLPKLIKEGFNGPIWCTPATKDLTEILLHDSAEIQQYEADWINKKRKAQDRPLYEPLYTTDDVATTIQLMQTVGYNEWFSPLEDVEVLFTNTGHLVGSAAVNLKVKEGTKETTICFSGDVGRYRSVLLQPPAEFPQADYIILESTYGNSYHDITAGHVDDLQRWIKTTCTKKGGKLVIPAFSVGRTQEILYALNQLSLEKRLPEVKVYVDSPLSMKATEAIKQYTDDFNDRLQQVLKIDDDPFHFEGLNYVESVEDSRKLVDLEEPCVIISASGTADAGRVRHHIGGCLADEKNTVLMAGYCGAQSLGGQLLSGAKEVEIFGEAAAVSVEVGKLASLSAHGDADDLVRFLGCQDAEKIKTIFLVHGEHEVQKEFAERLHRKGYEHITIPGHHEEVEL